MFRKLGNSIINMKRRKVFSLFFLISATYLFWQLSMQFNEYSKTSILLHDTESIQIIEHWRHDVNLSPVSVTDDKFTIVILTYNRPLQLAALLNYYGHFHSVQKIVVLWNDPSSSVPVSLRQIAASVPVNIEFVASESNKLTNRFLPRSNLQTQGIMW